MPETAPITAARIVHRITPSQAHAWFICPGLYQAQRRAPTAHAQSYASRLGSAVHALAHALDRADQQRPLKLPELLAQHWRPGAFTADDDPRARAEATALLCTYSALRQQECLDLLDGEVFLQNHQRVLGNGHAIVLSGRLDRVARLPDGSIEVLDLCNC